VIHAPIGESSVYGVSDFIYAKDIMISESKFDLIHCGDIHQRFLIKSNEKTICNPGPLLRIEASEDNFKFSPSFILYDSNTNETSIVEIPHKKSSEVLTREHLEREARVTTMLSQFIENVKTSEVSGVSFQEILFKLLEKESDEIKEIISEVMSKEDCDV
jgi:predicted DNA binding CopG/RHH family protein